METVPVTISGAQAGDAPAAVVYRFVLRLTEAYWRAGGARAHEADAARRPARSDMEPAQRSIEADAGGRRGPSHTEPAQRSSDTEPAQRSRDTEPAQRSSRTAAADDELAQRSRESAAADWVRAPRLADGPGFGFVPAGLRLAEAALRYARCLSDTAHDRPPQVVVLGPTQTGKSTVVNLLVGRQVAAASPLAGFTIHAEGFCVGTPHDGERWMDELFPGYTRCEHSELSHEDLAAFALGAGGVALGQGGVALGQGGVALGPGGVAENVVEGVVEAEAGGLPACVVWDTPDFDSLASHAYQQNVIEAAALADAYVMVLSKEKYSDLTAWQMLQLIEPLGRPLLVCLNKVTPDARDTLVESLEKRFGELTSGGGVPIVCIEYVPGSLQEVADALAPTGRALRERASSLCASLSADRNEAGIRELIRKHWEAWLAPVRAEHAALDEWRRLVDDALDALLLSYRRDYLDHPERFDSFRRAMAEVLHLLELPGISGALGRVRQLVSWPARELMRIGKNAWRNARRSHAGGPRLGSEQAVLEAAIEELLLTLRRGAAQRCDAEPHDATVWRAIRRGLDQDQSRLTERFRTAASAHHEQVGRDIQEAAGKLYEELRRRPAVLTTLRAARVTADVGSILLAIKMGGAHLNDLIFAPAMFALTSMLTEGALGTYMTRVAEDLKKRQMASVRAVLVDAVFRVELHDLPGRIEQGTLYGISPDELAAAAAALEQWSEHSDA